VVVLGCKRPRSEQKAHWINLYNALTIKVVLEHYPVKSIRGIKISPGILSSGPWGAKLKGIDGKRSYDYDWRINES
jgi:hypothetical protein